nr:stage II sporulation protein M [Propionicimonas sp.]
MSTSPRVPGVEAAVAAGLILAATVLTAVLASDSAVSAVAADAGVLPPADWGTFTTILLRNSAVALGLFSGAVTLGISTGVFLLLVGAMLGWSMAVSVAALGVAETVLRCWAYTPLELLGFVLAGAAGLVPALQLLRPGSRPATHGTLPRALRTLGLALAVLTLAAATETLSIALTAQRLTIA